MKYLSLFSGIGGFELGMHNAYVETANRKKNRGSKATPKTRGAKGYKKSQESGPERGRSCKHHHCDGLRQESLACVGYSEIDKHAIQIYEKYFKHKNYGDITKIKTKELPDFDMLIGGFPCQSFSIAGKRRGFKDTRGTLFFEISRILRDKQPRLFILENVKGLLSHDNGRTFRVIISNLDDLGYDLEWQVLNSKNFGVPQNRERVFIVGHLRGTSRPEIFPIQENGQTDIVIPTLTARYTASSNGGYVRHGQTHQINNPVHSNDRVYAADGINPTLNTMQGGNRQPKIIATQLRNSKKFGNAESDKNFMCLRASEPNGVRIGSKIRRLTPKECERLQGFPDGWTEGVSDTQRYKCLGNAVTVNVVQVIAEKLLRNISYEKRK